MNKKTGTVLVFFLFLFASRASAFKPSESPIRSTPNPATVQSPGQSQIRPALKKFNQQNKNNPSLVQDTADTVTRRFLSTEKKLLRVDPENLSLKKTLSHRGLVHLLYQQFHQGIPVEDGLVKSAVNAGGEIIYLNFTGWALENLVTTPVLTRQEAVQKALASLGANPDLKKEPLAELVIFQKQLSWKIRIFCRQPLGNWVFFVSAQTAEIIFYYNDLRFETSGRVLGAVFPSTGQDTLETRPLAYQYVQVRGNPALTDTNGDYSTSFTGSVWADLSGPYIRVLNEDEPNVYYSDGSGTWNTVDYSLSSPHPYGSWFDRTWTITQPAAQQIKVHFSAFETEFCKEEPCDRVYLYDKSEQEIGYYNGKKDPFWSLPVPGDTIKLRLKSDTYVDLYGFDLDQYSYFTAGSQPSPRPSWTWVYSSTTTQTDEVNVFYHLNEVHRYFKEEQKFTGLDFPVTAVVYYGKNYDNSFYDLEEKKIYFGEGDNTVYRPLSRGQDVIYHEYIHAVQEAIFSIPYYSQSGAMMEAWSDYFAASLTGDSRIGEWVYIPGPLRDIDSTTKFPANWTGEVHNDGVIFAAALWEIRKSLGQEITDRLVFDSFFFQPADFVSGLEAMLLADDDDKDLGTGTPHQAVIETAFANHGIVRELSGNNFEPNDSLNQSAGPLDPRTTYYAYIEHQGDIDWYKFYSASGSFFISLKVPWQKDYNLYLFNALLTDPFVSSQNSPGLDESISVSLPGGLYYLMVAGTGNNYEALNSYALYTEFVPAQPDITPPQDRPERPYGLPYSSSTLNITWKWQKGSVTDPESGLSGYEIEVWRTSQIDTIWSQGEKVTAKFLSGEQQYISTGCVLGSFYYARVRAKNGVGLNSEYSPVSQEVSFDTAPPQAVVVFTPLVRQSGVQPVTLYTTKSLVEPPLLTFTPQGKTPVKIEMTGEGRQWQGTLEITTRTGDGTATFNFSGQDFWGNIGTGISSGATFSIGTAPRGNLLTVVPNPLYLTQGQKVNFIYEITAAQELKIEVYDLSGEKVKEFALGSKEKGIYSELFWDGKNEYGRLLASGVYFVQLSSPHFQRVEKLILLK